MFISSDYTNLSTNQTRIHIWHWWTMTVHPQFPTQFITFHIVSKQDFNMFTDKTNSYKNIVVWMVSKILQDIWLNPWNPDITFTLPSVGILLGSQT